MARILIIEDNSANMKLATLHNTGHTVPCAVDAEAGLTLPHGGQPDLILMDLQLPGMDGLAGCDACIVKPLRYQQLYAALDTLLAGARPDDANPFQCPP